METGDSIQRDYPGRIEGKYGYLLLTKKKMMFIKEEGFLSKNYSVVFNLPYNRVQGYSTKQKSNLEIIDTSGGSQTFVSEVITSNIEDALKSLITASKVAVPVS
jgi:hypothetical protein